MLSVSNVRNFSCEFWMNVKASELHKSSVKAPESQKSRVKASELHKSSVKTPESQKSSVKAPKLKNPSVKAP